ncbi:hypothetical protein [Streptococcus dysgalactiae]|nr:hypothetical protein [Streptococcus dysgalactiae]
MSKLQRHQEALQKLMVFNNYCKSIIYISPEDNHPVDYFQGQLWMDVLYTNIQKSKETQLKGFWIYEFRTRIKNKGYGSLLLSEALWYISQHFGTSIEFEGWLSFVDERDPENHARRDHIY